ncbi:MAG TPA: hypothetical protein VFA52_03440 [Candidatus Paceibacterota bacterium]|nr:hypothetical protein [Candidatus Paceibacterota bacterium]
MNEEIFKIIEPQLQNLPSNIKEAILNNDIGAKLAEISKKHQLHIDQADILENETLMILVGLESADEYLNNLVRELRIPRDKASLIVDDVNNSIFSSIKSSLQTMAEKIKEEDAQEARQSNTESEQNLNKDNLLREIEEPVRVAAHSRPITVPDHQNVMPKRSSSGLANIGERLRDRDMSVTTDAKRMDDFRRAAMEEEMKSRTEERVEVAPKAQPISTPTSEVPAATILPDKLTETVRAPRQEIEVKETPPPTPTPPTPSKIDPYREPVN